MKKTQTRKPNAPVELSPIEVGAVAGGAGGNNGENGTQGVKG